MKTFEVTVDEVTVNTYWFTIEAETEEEAEDLALEKNFWGADNYTQNKPEYSVVDVEEV